MCNGETGRESIGGTIAILKPANMDPAVEEVSLLLADDQHTGRTSATISGMGNGWVDRQVVIHRDGDLRSNTTDESTILHRFAVPTPSQPGAAFPLSTKLDLGVGGQGIIGRRVSLLHGHVVAAEGILGWN